MRLPPLPSIKDILRLYKIRALKQLSQNFILNERITRKFVQAAGNISDHYVVEVGPGPGSITRSILEANIKHLTVVEKDSRFMESLKFLKEASTVPLDIVHGDILRYDLAQNLPEELKANWDSDPPKIHIIGNLPFSVSTPLIVRWLREISNRSGPWEYGRVNMTLTFQKEVGQRMVAPVEGEQRSRLSIMCQYLCNVKKCYEIPGTAFIPKPDVDVAVVTFEPKVKPLIDVPFPYVEKTVSHVFHHRNKIFKNCINTLFPPERPELIEELGNRSGIDINARPRQIKMEEFATLSAVYREICCREEGLFEYDYRAPKSVGDWRRRKAIWREMYGDDYYVEEPKEEQEELQDLVHEFQDEIVER